MTGGQRVVFGWREWVALPELGVATIKAKLDTGARTSSLHAFRIKRFRRDGLPMVRFEIHPVQRSAVAPITVEAPVSEERTVRDSGGHEQVRPVIVTEVEIDGRRWPIELTLTRRDAMGFRMLLGRQALRGRAVVDPGRSFVAGRKGGPRGRKTGKETGRETGRGKGRRDAHGRSANAHPSGEEE